MFEAGGSEAFRLAAANLEAKVGVLFPWLGALRGVFDEVDCSDCSDCPDGPDCSVSMGWTSSTGGP